jgi:hypothetical protein
MILSPLIVFACTSLLFLSAAGRLRPRTPTELENATRFAEIIVVGGALLVGFLALWDTTITRGGIWWAAFIPYTILGIVAGTKTKRRMEALVRESKAPPILMHNQSTDPTLASGTPGAEHQPRHP